MADRRARCRDPEAGQQHERSCTKQVDAVTWRRQQFEALDRGAGWARGRRAELPPHQNIGKPPATAAVRALREPVGDDPSMDRERQVRVSELLEHNVRTEIEIWNGARNAGLTDEQIQELAGSIAANVDYAFAVDWSPDWIKPGEVHSWEEGDGHFARCPTCLRDSPPSATRSKAVAWAKAHIDSH